VRMENGKTCAVLHIPKACADVPEFRMAAE
jgi:hypothetical protein